MKPTRIKNTAAIMLLSFAVIAPAAIASPTKPSPNSRIHKRHLGDQGLESKQCASSAKKECTSSRKSSKVSRQRTKIGGRWFYRKR